MGRPPKETSDEEPTPDKPKEEIKLVEVVKETDLAFQLPDGTALDEKGYLVWLGNQIWDIKRAVG